MSEVKRRSRSRSVRRERDAATCYESVVAAARSAGAFWSPKLARGISTEGIPGLLAHEPIEEGEILGRLPARLHLSRNTCSKMMSEVFKACEALPTRDSERRAEAAHNLSIALILASGLAPVNKSASAAHDSNFADTGQYACVAPNVKILFARYADFLLELDFTAHPYCRLKSCSEGLRKALACSSELDHVLSHANYVQTVYECICNKIDPTLLPDVFDNALFLKAWLCLLTREIKTPYGSALVPVVDMFNHSPQPNAELDWDEESDSLLVKTCRSVAVRDEICIAYGTLSNPLLWRTYGFTLCPSAEPTWTCTLLVKEVQRIVDLHVQPGVRSSDILADLPEPHLDAQEVGASAVALIEALREVSTANTSAGGTQPCPQVAELLRGICSSRIQRYQEDALLRPLVSAWESASTSVTNWWKLAADLKICSADADDAIRIQMSEYLCLIAHVEAIDCLQGQLTEERCLPAAAELREDFRTLRAAGLL